MYQVYFSSLAGRRLWHPAVTFELVSATDAFAVAEALLRAIPTLAFAYGPKDRDGLVEVE